MFKLRFPSGAIAALSFALCTAFAPARADDETGPPLSADVRMLIDVSGSMKQNDPGNLRRPALELVVQLLQDGDKAGVWTFGRYINMLVPHRPVTPAWRQDASRKAGDINSLGLFTNIGEALEKAAYDLDQADPGHRTSLILLTDGMVDIARDPERNRAEWRRIVDEVLPRLQNAGYTVHTIALSDNADTDLMNKLALGTDGIAAVAHSAEDLMKIFLRAFDRAAPAEQVPLNENRFVIDSSVEEFTALIFRKAGGGTAAALETRLIGPDDSGYSFDREDEDVNWYRADVYDLITVKRPLEGEWQVRADMDPDSRVTVVSDLNLRVKPLGNNIFRGDDMSLSLVLQEDGETITRAEFLRLLDIDVAVDQRQSANAWRLSLSSAVVPPADGIYSAELPYFNEEGRYDIKVQVDGKSFKREFSHTVVVREPFDVELEKQIDSGEPVYRLTVSANGQTLDREKTKVVARIKNPRGRSAIRPLSLTEVDSWEVSLQPDLDGVYQVALRISGVDKAGREFEFEPQPLSFAFPDGEDPFAAQPAAAPEPEVKPEPAAEAEPEPEDVEPEPAPATQAGPAAAQTPAAPEPAAKWPLYVGLGVGNLLIIGLAFFAYRMIMGGKSEESLEDLEKAVAATEAEADDSLSAAAEVAAEPEPDPGPGSEMQMDEVAEAAVDEIDSDLADSLMAGDLDLASDASSEADIDTGESSSALDGLDMDDIDLDSAAKIEDIDDDGGFSLDDFDTSAADIAGDDSAGDDIAGGDDIDNNHADTNTADSDNPDDDKK